MSYQATRAVWEHSQQKGTNKMVLLYIAERANEAGIAFPSIPNIADYCDISDRHAKRIVHSLVTSNELIILEKGNGRGNKTTYQIGLLKRVTSEPQGDPIKGDIKGDIMPEKGDIPTQKRVTSGDIKGDITMSPEYPIEYPKEYPGDPVFELEQHFERLTGFFMPHETTINRQDDWKKPCEAILGQTTGLDSAKQLLGDSLKFARTEGYTVKTPNSLLTIALNMVHGNGRKKTNEPSALLEGI